VAANLGYCGLDARRQPLVGDEIRACWEARAAVPVEDGPLVPIFQPSGAADRRRLEFVELDGTRSTSPAPASSVTTPPALTPEAVDAVEPLGPADRRWSLWGDLDR
jgi:hypothetical protein